MALTAFLSYAVLAGGNAVCIRFSNRELAPLWGASLRFALAAALLLAVMLMFKLAFPRGRALAGSLLYGLFNIGAGFGLIYYGLVQIHAGLAQILLALVPLATLLLAVLWRQERLHAAAVMGTLLALAGVAVVSRSPLREDVPMLSVLAVIGGAICFAQALVLGTTLPKRAPRDHERHRDDGGSCFASCSLTGRERADRVPAPPPDMGSHGLPGCDRLGRRLPPVLGRSPVLGGVTSVLRIRDHPVRYRRALGLA